MQLLLRVFCMFISLTISGFLLGMSLLMQVISKDGHKDYAFWLLETGLQVSANYGEKEIAEARKRAESAKHPNSDRSWKAV